MYLFVFMQVLKKISRYIKDQNEKIYAPRGLLLTDPIERGLRVVSFVWLLSNKYYYTGAGEVIPYCVKGIQGLLAYCLNSDI